MIAREAALLPLPMPSPPANGDVLSATPNRPNCSSVPPPPPPLQRAPQLPHQLCVDAKDWTQVIASVTLLCKRRGVLRKVAQGVIRAGVAALEANVSSLSKESRVSLIDCLRAVSKGKIFVELEHARLTQQLAHIHEREDKDVAKASELLSEVTVETIGAMDRFEKVAITLEQARLLLLAGDTIKAAIVGKKIK